MSEKTWVSALTLLGSLSSYYYARSQGKDAVPYVMIGGFLGAIAGEVIVKALTRPKPPEQNSDPKNPAAAQQPGAETKPKTETKPE